MKNLEELKLCATKVSDVSALGQLTKLKRVMLDGTQVSVDDIRKLMAKLPSLTVYGGGIGKVPRAPGTVPSKHAAKNLADRLRQQKGVGGGDQHGLAALLEQPGELGGGGEPACGVPQADDPPIPPPDALQPAPNAGLWFDYAPLHQTTLRDMRGIKIPINR